MKAFLLSAGNGTRLRPLTEDTPKCLVEVKKKPLLYWWTKLFEKYGVDTVLINAHHLSDQVVDYVSKSKSKLNWNVIYEQVLLGSAGTIAEQGAWVRREPYFLIAYSDVLTNCNLKKVVEFHKASGAEFTMVVAPVADPRGKGIVEIGDGGVVTSFVEKPRKPKSNIANMGIYVCSPPILKYISDVRPCDIGIGLLPQLVGKMRAYLSNEYFCDIGTIENLKKANEEFGGI